MKAVVHDRYGEPEELHLRELPEPQISDQECLVKVTAVSVNPSDWKTHLGRVPKNVALADAAGIPVACSTAYVGLRHRRKDLRGKRVLLTGGGGGVGQFVIQLGKLFGAHITAVCSESKMELCRELGADRVLDYRRTDPLTGGDRYDLVFNCASSISFREAKSILNPGGEYLLLETQGRIWLFLYSLFSQLTPGKRLWAFLVGPDGERYNRLAELIESNDLRVVVGSRYPMERAVEAFRENKNGHATGKIIINVPG